MVESKRKNRGAHRDPDTAPPSRTDQPRPGVDRAKVEEGIGFKGLHPHEETLVLDREVEAPR